jgi:hypothetical protein
MRLRDLHARVNGFGYAITNGIWPVEIPADIAKKFEDRRHAIIKPTNNLPNVPIRRRAIWIAFLLLAAVPVFFLFRKKR